MRARKVFTNFTFLAAGKVLGDAATFLLFIFLSRAYGQQGIGEYSFAMAIAGFLVVAADFGLYNLSIKDISRSLDSIPEYYSRVILVRVGLSAVALLLLLLTVWLLPLSSESTLIILAIGIYQVIYTLTDGFSAVFIARQEMHVASTIEISLRLPIAILAIALALSGAPILTTISVFPILASVHLLGVIRFAVARIGFRWPDIERSQLFSLLRTAVPYALFTLLRQATTRVDVLLLGLIMGTVAAGVYNVAYRIVFVLLFIPFYCGLAIFPIASRMFAEKVSELADFYHGAARLIVLLAVPMVVGLFLIAPKLIILLFGIVFYESTIILQILSVLVGLAFFKSIAGTCLTSCDLQAARTKLQWLAAVLNLTGNLILIPVLGLIGAAISTVFSELVLTVLSILKLRPLCGIPNVASRAVIAVSGAAAFTSFWLVFPDMHVLFFVPSAVAIYVAVLLSFESIRSDEVMWARSIIRGGEG